MEAWEFFGDNASGWRWRCVDLVENREAQSTRGFASRNDCIADAMRHGYLADPAMRTSRRELVHPQ